MEQAVSATEELRRLLDERGVVWDGESHTDATFWNEETNLAVASDDRDGKLWVSMRLTPDQAIEGTLGRPKVKKVRGMTYDHAGGEVYFLACSGCGEWIDGDLGCIGEDDGPKFCSNCGGEFDGPKLCRKCGRLADLEYGDLCAECYEGGAE